MYSKVLALSVFWLQPVSDIGRPLASKKAIFQSMENVLFVAARIGTVTSRMSAGSGGSGGVIGFSCGVAGGTLPAVGGGALQVLVMSRISFRAQNLVNLLIVVFSSGGGTSTTTRPIDWPPWMFIASPTRRTCRPCD